MRLTAMALFVAACGKPAPHLYLLPDAPAPIDAPSCSPTAAPTVPAADLSTCDVLAQTGCQPGEKCTWIHDGIGRIGCVPSGRGELGCACSYGAVGTTGYDDCEPGLMCLGVCKSICDLNGGAPMCDATHVCARYDGLLGPLGQAAAAGVCDLTCDPLADNDLLGSGASSSACGSNAGCYGVPQTLAPTHFACSVEIHSALVHRSPCTTANGCAGSNAPYLNGCASGYMPLLADQTGSTQIDCVAVCKPGNTYLGNSGTQSAAGQSPHTCTTADARGSFDTTTDGDHCMYSWRFEIDSTGHFTRSPTSDTVGFCVNHSKYRYDSNGDGVIDGNDATMPPCESLPLTAPSGQPTAGDLGCVDTATAGTLPTTRLFPQ